jgi:hypothetical protein
MLEGQPCIAFHHSKTQSAHSDYIGGRSVRDLACCFSPVENGEIIEPYLYSLRNRLSNKIKFTDIDRYGARLSGASFVTIVRAKDRQMEQ